VVHTLVILLLRRLRQEDQEFEVGLHSETLSQKKKSFSQHVESSVLYRL
jgi:hypothetical protein